MARSSGKPRTVAVDVDGETPKQPWRPTWPWYVTAGVGPIAVLLACWVVLGALAAVGWLTSPHASLGNALGLASRVLLLANGAPTQIGGVNLSIAPLGVSLLLIVLGVPIASYAARQAAGDGADPDDTGRIWVDGEAVTMKVGGCFAGVYVVGVVIVAALCHSLTMRALLGAVTIGVVTSLWGASRGVAYDPTSRWPSWLRAVPRAMGAALCMMLAGGAALLAVALWVSREQVVTIGQQLDGGPASVFLLTALHLAYLPNFVLACVSWILGAGVTLGDGSLITMATSDVGLLPAIPIMGAVPGPGFGSTVNFWWLLVGVVAGAMAGAVITLARPRARFDETALVGGLSGVLAGVCVVVACGLGSGSLGSQRLAAVGARLGPLAVFAPTLLGLSGMLAGLLLGLLRRPPRDHAPEPGEEAVGLAR